MTRLCPSFNNLVCFDRFSNTPRIENTQPNGAVSGEGQKKLSQYTPNSLWLTESFSEQQKKKSSSFTTYVYDSWSCQLSHDDAVTNDADDDAIVRSEFFPLTQLQPSSAWKLSSLGGKSNGYKTENPHSLFSSMDFRACQTEKNIESDTMAWFSSGKRRKLK